MSTTRYVSLTALNAALTALNLAGTHHPVNVAPMVEGARTVFYLTITPNPA